MEPYGIVYMIKNKVNKKIYFGVTTSKNGFDGRYSHNIALNTKNEHLKHSIEKYGIDNFEINKQFDIAYSKHELGQLEDMYICLYNTLDPRYGYNKKRGGQLQTYSIESRQKMSDSQKQFAQQDDYVNPFKGKKHSDKTKQINSQKHKGKQTWLGKSHTEEAKEKNRQAHLGKGTYSDNGNSKSVMCINTGQIFTTLKEAAEWCGQKKTSGIRMCINAQRKSAGKHPITGEPLTWQNT